MDQAEKDRLVSEFCSISNVDEGRALFFLESSHWELDVALGNFYENNDGDTINEAVVESENVAIPASAGIESNPTNVPESMKNITSPPQTTYAPSKKFASIHDYKNKDDDDNEEEGQRFYAGGSEHSGELIVGPKSKSNLAIASNLFKQAKTHGAEVVDEEESPKPGSSRSAFSGSGYRLGDSSMPSESVVNPTNQKPEPDRVVLRLWSNGFTVGDGELRSFQDPENREFLGSIAKGEIPKELIKSSTKVHLNMEDHRNEEYKKVKPKMVPFSGTGYSLSSESSVKATSATTTQPETSNPIVVDESKPKTTVQIRLVDGTRVRQVFNHSHTVADIQAFVAYSSSASNFVLMTTFPNHELKVLTQTLVEAKLLNSSIVQKLA